MSDKYFLKTDWQDDWQEVTKKQYISAERSAGFRSKFGDDSVATGGFSSGGVEGEVRYNRS